MLRNEHQHHGHIPSGALQDHLLVPTYPSLLTFQRPCCVTYVNMYNLILQTRITYCKDNFISVQVVLFLKTTLLKAQINISVESW
jgi:hypothetical protein